jgi:hypothetical protein
MALLESRYSHEVEVSKGVDIKIEELRRAKHTSAPLLDTRSTDVQAFMDFLTTL